MFQRLWIPLALLKSIPFNVYLFQQTGNLAEILNCIYCLLFGRWKLKSQFRSFSLSCVAQSFLIHVWFRDLSRVYTDPGAPSSRFPIFFRVPFLTFQPCGHQNSVPWLFMPVKLWVSIQVLTIIHMTLTRAFPQAKSYQKKKKLVQCYSLLSSVDSSPLSVCFDHSPVS